jgi:predicted amidohydrolase YtcJ
MKFITAKPINTLRTIAYGLALAACIAGFASVASSAAAKAKDVKADVVYRNGFVYTVDGVRSRAEAFAVKDGKFIAVGSNDDMKAVTGKNTKTVNLKGKMVMPGLVDAHIHPVRGALTSLGAEFPVTASIDEIKAAVKNYMADKKVKAGDWVEGAKWGTELAPQLKASMLDEIAPNNPVYLHDFTNHLAWVNSKALEAAKITKDTPDPPGGVIERDSSGNPTGVLHDSAIAPIAAAMPPPTQDMLQERARWIFNKLNSYGVTSIATAQLNAERLKAYRALESQGKLTVRIKGHWDWNTRYATKSLEEMAKAFDTREKRGPKSPLIDPDGVKIYTDGVPDGHGSPYIEPYIDAPTFGTQHIDEPTLSTWVLRFDAIGLQVMMHAVGDMAVRHSLNALEATRKANGKGPHHHLAHVAYIHPEDLPRLADLNISTEISPYQLWVPSPAATAWTKLLGRQRMDGSFGVIGSMIKAGANLTYGSDYDNVPEPDPWFAMEGMITRKNPAHPEYGSLNPTERIDVETAIQVFTINGAYNIEAEDETGSIEPGKSADFIVINQNLLKIPPEKIHKTKVLRTVLKGKTVYEGK